MAGAKRLERRHHQARGDRLGRGDHDGAVEAAVLGRQLEAERADFALDAPRVGQQLGAGAGRLQALPAALEQLAAELGLERVEPARHRRGVDAQRARRRRQAAGVGDREHEAEVIPIPAVAEFGRAC